MHLIRLLWIFKSICKHDHHSYFSCTRQVAYLQNDIAFGSSRSNPESADASKNILEPAPGIGASFFLVVLCQIEISVALRASCGGGTCVNWGQIIEINILSTPIWWIDIGCSSSAIWIEFITTEALILLHVAVILTCLEAIQAVFACVRSKGFWVGTNGHLCRR